MTNLNAAAATLGDKASELRESAEDLVQAAGKKMKDGRNQTSEAIRNLAGSAADTVDAAASYVENADLLTDLRSAIRKNPGRSLLVATAIGLAAGCAIRQFTYSCGSKA